jgi:prepilin-type N-terminal cleavage/methylation domain-containing protein
MHTSHSRGFTLIELLVVIAIIGILSSVVLASLNTARTKASDAAIKSDLNGVGTQAALFLSNNSTGYGAFDNGAGGPAACPTGAGTSVFHDPNIEKAIAAALANAPGGTALCYSTNAAYAVAVSRPDTTLSTYWCADSTGAHCGISSLTGTSCGTTCTQ